jgi:single-strand DNA-binding protein
MAGDTVITVVGNLTADPELRFTASGAAVANFTVASTPRTFDRASNEWKDGEALFLRCNIWRQAAENVAETLTRGARVIVSGRLKQRSFETKEGEKRTVIELEVDEIGPSLRYATAKVNRANRGPETGGGGGYGGSGGGGGGNSGGGNSGGGSGSARSSRRRLLGRASLLAVGRSSLRTARPRTTTQKSQHRTSRSFPGETMPKPPVRKIKKKVCAFCKDNAAPIDYKDTNLLRKFISDRGKIRARRVTGNCTQHQRDVATAVKNAREVALLPYTSTAR